VITKYVPARNRTELHSNTSEVKLVERSRPLLRDEPSAIVAQSVCVFCMDLSTNSYYFPIQH